MEKRTSYSLKFIFLLGVSILCVKIDSTNSMIMGLCPFLAFASWFIYLYLLKSFMLFDKEDDDYSGWTFICAIFVLISSVAVGYNALSFVLKRFGIDDVWYFILARILFSTFVTWIFYKIFNDGKVKSNKDAENNNIYSVKTDQEN